MENPNLDNQNSTQPKKTNTLINEEEDYSKQKLQIISPKEEVEEKINKMKLKMKMIQMKI